MVCKNLNSARSKSSSICRVSWGIRANPVANSGVAAENRVFDRVVEEEGAVSLFGPTPLESGVDFAASCAA